MAKQHSLLCLQVGQVILTLPNAFSSTGLAAGVFFQLVFATVALWTLFLMATLYQEFRRRKAVWRRDLHHGIIMVAHPPYPARYHLHFHCTQQTLYSSPYAPDCSLLTPTSSLWYTP